MLIHLQIPGGQMYKSPGEAYVEGDASSASYFLAGATITGGTVVVEGCGSDSLQGDVRFAKVSFDLPLHAWLSNLEHGTPLCTDMHEVLHVQYTPWNVCCLFSVFVGLPLLLQYCWALAVEICPYI